MSTQQSVTLDKIVALCKRRGFVYQSAEIYGGLNGVYDIGHLGYLLKENIKNAWKKSILSTEPDILFLDGALLGAQQVWIASGHVENFSDPMVDCLNCKHRYRADEMDLARACPHCGKTSWTQVRQFNLMFKTHLGAMENDSSIAYLRPETAQSIFVNFKNVLSTNRVKIPFGIAQIGKAFEMKSHQNNSCFGCASLNKWSLNGSAHQKIRRRILKNGNTHKKNSFFLLVLMQQTPPARS